MPTDSFTSLPSELLDAVFPHISSTHDLLSLALTCSRLQSLIVQTHLEYRIIRCDVQHTFLWATLAQNKVLASKVTALEVVDEDAALWIGVTPTHKIVPSNLANGIMSSDEQTSGSALIAPLDICHEESSVGQSMASAVANMHNLTTLMWGSRLYHIPNAVGKALLGHCPLLTNVEVTFGRVGFSACDLIHVVEHPIWDLRKLTRFSLSDNLTFIESPISQSVYLSQVVSFLIANHQTLKTVQIDLSHADEPSNASIEFHAFFTETRFPALESLYMSDACYIYYDLQLFLEQHSKIKSLALPYPPRDLVLDLSSLEELTSVEAGFSSSIIPLGVLSKLRFISLRDDDGPLFESRLAQATSLERLVMRWYSTWGTAEYDTLVRAVPKDLTRLGLLWDDVHLLFNLMRFSGAGNFTQTLFDNIDQRLLAQLQKLTHISGVILSVYLSFILAPVFEDGKRMLKDLTRIPCPNSTTEPWELQPFAHRLAAALQLLSVTNPSLEYMELQAVGTSADHKERHIDCWMGPKRWLKIVRGEDGSYVGWEWVKVKKPGLDVHEWGGLMRDIGGLGDMWY